VTSLFDAEARRGAIASSLPLLATYFSAADSWRLRTQPALSAEIEADQELARAVRLRVLLGLGRELIEIVTTIVEQPSFRYGRQSEYSVGVVSGRLDVPRYVRSRGQVESPRRYPIHQVERHLATPENVLAAAALEALTQDLADAPTHVLEQAGPERREIGEIQATLARLGQLPLLAELRAEGRRSADRRHLERLCALVARRLERREIAHPQPYENLVAWVADLLAGSCAKPGSQPWAFYEESFDARLFEIWLLSSVLRALEEKYGEPEGDSIRPLWERDEKPQAAWTTAAGRIELFFQREAKTVGMQGRWKVRGTDHRVRAIPDLVLRLTTPDRTRCIVIDAKLRRHQPLPQAAGEPLNLPSEEIYKMLGYFEQLRPEPGPVGYLVYYTPGFARTATLESGSGEELGDGTLALAGVDPALVEDSQAAMHTLTDLVAELLGEPSREIEEEAAALELEAIAQGADPIEATAVRKARLYREIGGAYSQRHPEQRSTVEATTRSSFAPEVWQALEEESRRMLVSSEMYALHQAPAMDFSGPLLVLCAACERELNRRVFAPLAQAIEGSADEDSPPVPAHPPLGTGLYILRKAVDILRAEEKNKDEKVEAILAEAQTDSDAYLWRLLADWLQATGLEHKHLNPLIEALAKLNGRYRRPSAHDEPVEQEVWIDGRGQILGPAQLLSSVVSTFALGT
jgi:hypothetical protein